MKKVVKMRMSWTHSGKMHSDVSITDQSKKFIISTLRDKQFKDDLAKMKEELGRRQEAKAEASSSAAAAES